MTEEQGDFIFVWCLLGAKEYTRDSAYLWTHGSATPKAKLIRKMLGSERNEKFTRETTAVWFLVSLAKGNNKKKKKKSKPYLSLPNATQRKKSHARIMLDTEARRQLAKNYN